VIIRQVPADELDGFFAKAARWIASACHRSGDVESAAGLRERAQDMLVLDLDGHGVALLERDGPWCHATTLAGDHLLEHMPQLIQTWLEIAYHTGCTGISLRGRKGWDRVLAPYGFRKNGNNLEASWA
jgi:hypothetical protein